MLLNTSLIQICDKSEEKILDYRMKNIYYLK
jgi:hypothetical protein